MIKVKIRSKVKDPEKDQADLMLGEEVETEKECEKAGGEFCYMSPATKTASKTKKIKTKPTEKTVTLAEPVKKKRIGENNEMFISDEEISKKNKQHLEDLVKTVSPELRASMLDLWEMYKDSGTLEYHLSDRHFVKKFMDKAYNDSTE